MTRIIIERVPEDLVAVLARRAASSGRTVEQEATLLLISTLSALADYSHQSMSWDELVALGVRFSRAARRHVRTDSTDDIRGLRDGIMYAAEIKVLNAAGLDDDV